MSFVASSLYSNRHILTPASLGVLHHSIRSKRHRNRAKRGKNEFLFGMLWCFLGIFGDNKGQKLNIFLKVGKVNGWRCCRLSAFWRVHWSEDSGPFGDSGPAGGWLWSSGRVFLSFCPLFCLALGGLLANMPLFRVLRAFLGGFMVLVWVCVGCVLCVDCVAFVRVWS